MEMDGVGSWRLRIRGGWTLREGGRGYLYAGRGEVEMLDGGWVMGVGVFWVYQIVCVQKMGSKLVVLRLLIQNFCVQNLWLKTFPRQGDAHGMMCWGCVMGVHI